MNKNTQGINNIVLMLSKKKDANMLLTREVKHQKVSHTKSKNKCFFVNKYSIFNASSDWLLHGMINNSD